MKDVFVFDFDFSVEVLQMLLEFRSTLYEVLKRLKIQFVTNDYWSILTKI
jgi:hypothetical protein